MKTQYFLEKFLRHYTSLYLIIMESQNSRKQNFLQTNCNYEGEENDD